MRAVSGVKVGRMSLFIITSDPIVGDSAYGTGYLFGTSVSLNSTGDTLAVGAPGEDSAATGINGEENNAGAENSGAVYVFYPRQWQYLEPEGLYQGR